MKMNKPNITLHDVFTSCTENMNDENKNKYAPCFDEIVLATQDYEKKMEQGAPQDVASCSVVSGLSHTEMGKLYKDKLAKLRQPARKYYDQIKAGAPRGMCPYCRQRTVSTLDHYCPQAHYASLVISPSNLVPACAECNKNKLDITFFHQKECAFFNPYYEDSDQFIWLKASLREDLQSDELTMSFCVDPPDECDLITRKRLGHQFIKLKLDKLYGIHAAEELIGVRSRCLRIYKADGPSEVKKSIQESIKDNEYRPNSWQAAMYRALDSEWFYDSWLPTKVS